ncbi:hypothetical protein OXX80_006300 [Metschnikowia pulcherrima]
MTSISPERSHSVSSAAASTQPIPKKSLQIRTDKPRPHLCAICTRGFARLEHLKRHERAHTNEKPYQCAACGRCFARRDLVLRHQQKLHSNIFSVARRGSLPATLSQPENESQNANENVIILRNNTRAKAPLPESSTFGAASLLAYSDSVESSSQSSPRGGTAEAGPTSDNRRNSTENRRNLAHQHHTRQPGVIPSPNTNSYHNTPSGPATTHGNGSSFSDLDMLQHHNISVTDYTQQPSPLTGDSPELREKQKLKDKQRQDFLNDQLEFKSSFDLKNFTQYGKSQPNPRHASFSAVSGLSYTNLQDALQIRNTQPPQGPPQVAYSTPQLNPTEPAQLDYSALPSDFHGAELDWYSMDFGSRVGQHAEPVDDPLVGKQKANGGFKMSLNTIPSESHLAANYMGENGPNNIIASHQFQNPDHPHHIPGTTPMEFGFPLADDPLQNSEFPKIPYGTGFSQLTQDILYLQEHDAHQQQPSPRASDGSPNDGHMPDKKRQKLGFVNDIDDLTWLEQFKGIPLSNELPPASTDTGFLGMPFVKDEFQSDEVFSLFQMKQADLVRQRSRVDLSADMAKPGQMSRQSSRAQFTIGEPSEFITDDLRAKIVSLSNVSDENFPPKEDLNAYMTLYGEEFNSYFSFVHLPTLKNPMIDNCENIPMILAMCAIGALYSYHDSNTLLLFNLSKYHIHKFFETEVTPNKLQLKKVPIMAHQCLVLHIFISMFLNEPNMVEITARQMGSMVGLIRSTNFHRPLENFLTPPPAPTNPNDHNNLQNNYGYFIMAQTRIRTILTFYQLEVVRSILLGGAPPMAASEIQSGVYCSNEELWKSGDAGEWRERFLGEQKGIVDVSNNSSLQALAEQLNGVQPAGDKPEFGKALILLMYVHEQISSSYVSASGTFDPFTWRMDHRPRLEYLIMSWEEFFVKNGGSAIINNQNQALLNDNSELKMILPLSLLAKMRLSINISPVTSAVLHRDWNGMRRFLADLDSDPEGLKEASKHALEILDLWTHNISVVNDAKQTSVRTPVFFLTAVFIAVLILGKTLDMIENGKNMTVFERAFWLNAEKVLRTIETTLASHEQSTYSEFLNKQTGGLFDFAQGKAYQKNVETVRVTEKAAKVRSVKKCKLSTQTLGLGVRILADAPLWPLAMRFAEALKHIAMDINGRT